MKKQFLIIGSALMLSFSALAQLKVHDDGNTTIGSTATPSSGFKFQIIGKSAFTATNSSITSSAMIRGNNGYSTASTPDYTYYGDTTTGVFHPANNIFGITIGGNEKMRIISNGSFGFGTTSPNTNYMFTMNSSGGYPGGIIMTLAGASSASYGININASSYRYSGILFTNNTPTNGVFYGTGSVLSSTNIVSGYTAYRNSSGKSYGIYGINGTTSTYATSSNTWAAFLQGRTVISSETSPTSTIGTDLEIRNTTTGASAPVTLSMRQTNSLTTTGNILANINFGDNYSTAAQARIQVTRDATSTDSTDIPTAISFSTIANGSTTLTERMKIKNNGYVGFGTSSPDARVTIDGIDGYTTGLHVIKRDTLHWEHNIVSEVEGIETKSITTQYNDTDRFIVWGDGRVNINCNYHSTDNWLNIEGDAYAHGLWTTSDLNFKKNISDIDTPLDKIKQLKGKKFEFKTETFPQMDFSKGFTYGVIAQELQAIIPEIVKADSAGYLSVNYIGLIPILIEALKEQQSQIETLLTDVDKCCKKNDSKSLNLNNNSGSNTSIDNTEKSTASYLMQNRPNPFSRETVIDYFIAEDATNASIMIFDLNGKLLKTIAINGTGKGSATVSGSELYPGMYLYSLVINGVEKDTKRMILSE